MEVVRLVDRVGVDSVIRDTTFQDALIVGPAVIALLERVTMENCSFDGDPDSLFIEIEPNRGVIGVVGLVNTTFRGCRLQNIGIIGTRDAIEVMRSELLRGTAAAATAAASTHGQQPPAVEDQAAEAESEAESQASEAR